MNSVTPVDLHWLGHPHCIASALLQFNKMRFLIDPGPSSGLPTLRHALRSHHLSVSDLDALLLTHIHLDHAGATGSLVCENPNLRVFVHSLGAPHLVDPSRLLSSAHRLYGDDLDRLFGSFLPVPQSNLEILNGGESIPLGEQSLDVVYTPGHASHHVTYYLGQQRIAFVGDTTGICINGDAFVLPATPPPDINLELWDASLDTIAQLQPQRLFLTHFGFSDDPRSHLANYRKRLHTWSEIAGKILEHRANDASSLESFLREVADEASAYLRGKQLEHYAFNGALDLSWLGLVRYHRKRTKPTHHP